MLKTEEVDAFWISSWPFAEYVRHAWAGAWVCSAFRNEGSHLSSDLIREAVAATVDEYGPAPALGMVTFVNSEKIRRKRDPGRCFLRAGFRECGMTKGGLIAFQLLPDEMPEPARPMEYDRHQGQLFEPGIQDLRLGRKFIGIEISREYCDIAVQRMERELSQPMLPGLEPEKVVQGTMFKS